MLAFMTVALAVALVRQDIVIALMILLAAKVLIIAIMVFKAGSQTTASTSPKPSLGASPRLRKTEPTGPQSPLT